MVGNTAYKLFKHIYCFIFIKFVIVSFWVEFDQFQKEQLTRFYGVMVSTQDSESCDPSSNLGRTFVELNEF